MLGSCARHSYALELRRQGDGLRATVSGERTLANTIAYWESIVAEVTKQPPKWLFLCDRLHGYELAIEEWRSLVERMKGKAWKASASRTSSRAAWTTWSTARSSRARAGIDARAFADVGVAERWLH